MYRYYPLIDEKQCIKMESKSFLQRIYNGSPKTMIVNFIEDDYLSNEEIEELKQILGERK
jgi:BlaI family penicillinase repressor